MLSKTKIETYKETYKLKAAALSDRGQSRPVNEDTVFHFSEHVDENENIGLYIVSDGIGGYEAGMRPARLWRKP